MQDCARDVDHLTQGCLGVVCSGKTMEICQEMIIYYYLYFISYVLIE